MNFCSILWTTFCTIILMILFDFFVCFFMLWTHIETFGQISKLFSIIEVASIFFLEYYLEMYLTLMTKSIAHHWKHRLEVIYIGRVKDATPLNNNC